MKCYRRKGKISRKARSTDTFIDEKQWLNVTEHKEDISRNMAACFPNLLSFNTRPKQIDTMELAGRVIAAMLVRHAANGTFTGDLPTSLVRGHNLSHEISNGIPSYRGPLWLRFLLCGISVLAVLSCIGLMVTKLPVPITIISITSSLGEVVGRHRASCGSETHKT